MNRTRQSQVLSFMHPCQNADRRFQLREQVLQALDGSGYPALRRVECRVADGLVRLEGIVGSYFLKQLAQVTAARVCGTCEIHNAVVVRSTRQIP